MKPLRYQLVEDAGHHLSQDLMHMQQRHLLMMQAGGLTTAEASAAVMSAVEGLASIAVALTVFETAKPHARRDFITEIAGRLCRKLDARAERLVQLMAETDNIR